MKKCTKYTSVLCKKQKGEFKMSDTNKLFESFNHNLKEDSEFDYKMLDRLKSDCEYFLGNGNSYEKHLHQGNVENQIAKMKEIYNSLKEKPEWLTMEDIENYEKEMLAKREEKKLNNNEEPLTEENSNKIKESSKSLKFITEAENDDEDIDVDVPLDDIDDETEEEKEDEVETKENQEETVDSEEDQDENPVEEESELDKDLRELREILVDLDDLRLYKITR